MAHKGPDVLPRTEGRRSSRSRPGRDRMPTERYGARPTEWVSTRCGPSLVGDVNSHADVCDQRGHIGLEGLLPCLGLIVRVEVDDVVVHDAVRWVEAMQMGPHGLRHAPRAEVPRRQAHSGKPVEQQVSDPVRRHERGQGFNIPPERRRRGRHRLDPARFYFHTPTTPRRTQRPPNVPMTGPCARLFRRPRIWSAEGQKLTGRGQVVAADDIGQPVRLAELAAVTGGRGTQLGARGNAVGLSRPTALSCRSIRTDTYPQPGELRDQHDSSVPADAVSRSTLPITTAEVDWWRAESQARMSRRAPRARGTPRPSQFRGGARWHGSMALACCQLTAQGVSITDTHPDG